MAERGAHLSQLLLDSSRPSIFELVAQEGLNQALRGTIKFFFRVGIFLTYPSADKIRNDKKNLNYRSVQIIIQKHLEYHFAGQMKFSWYLTAYSRTIIYETMVCNFLASALKCNQKVILIYFFFYRCIIFWKLLWAGKGHQKWLQIERQGKTMFTHQSFCSSICFIKIRYLFLWKAAI